MNVAARISVRSLARLVFGTSALFGAVGFAAVLVHHEVRGARGQPPEGWVRLFGLNQEANAPTWFATVLLLLVAVLTWVSCRESRARGEVALGRGFGLLSAVFLFLSFDEASSVHEFVSASLGEGRGALRFFWVVPYGAAVVVLGLFLLPWLRALDGRTRGLAILAAVGFLGAALGFEMAQGLWTERYGWGLGLDLLTAMEELLEMLSVSLFAVALAARLQRREASLELGLEV